MPSFRTAEFLIAIAAAVLAPGVHAESVRPEPCFSAPICVTVSHAKTTLDFNYESLTDQPYTVAVSSTQHGLGGINHSIQFRTSALDMHIAGIAEALRREDVVVFWYFEPETQGRRLNPHGGWVRVLRRN